MKAYIIPLSDPQANLETVGGKGMSLAKLATAGLPVPGGFHVTTEAYRHFVDQNDLQAAIEAALTDIDILQPKSLDVASQEIRAMFSAAPIPYMIADAIISAYAALPDDNPPVAVRSSATAEDLPEASFAGQQDTYLNISDPEAVLEATRKCWASLWTARAIGYRARQKIAPGNVALAVVIQELVFAESAGVLFTVNPINGQRDQMMVSASWGLGEAVVGGLVTPDSLTLEKPSGYVIARQTAHKLVQTVRVNGGTKEISIPEYLQDSPVLSDRSAAELCHLGLQIEDLYGMPMDIEWTLTDRKFAIVQARPITTLPEAPIELNPIESDPIVWTPPDPKGTYMRTSVADLMPEPLSPLFVTLGIPTQREQMQPLGKRLLGSDPVLAKDYFTSINNYAYMNAAFPPKAWWWVLTGMLPAYPRLLRTLVPLWREEIHPEYQAFVASKQDIQPAQMSPGELWRETQELVDAAAYYVCGLMFATMGASAGSEGLLTRVYQKLARQNGDPEAAALLMGWDNIPVRSEKSLYDIATWILEDDDLAGYILHTSSHDLADQLKTPDTAPITGFSDFAAQFQAHLENFGHIVFQLDFAEPLPLDHPEIMLENIKMYLRGQGSNPHERQQASEQKRIRTTETMLKRLKGPKLWAFRKALNWAQSMAEVREDALSEIGLAYPKIRELLRELGQRFVEAGAIHQIDDIFWLEKEEISACIANLENQRDLVNLAGRIDGRKAFDERIRQTTPPPMMPMKKRVMGIKTELFIAQTEGSQSGNVLKGEATSVGKVTAPACVLHGAEDFEQMQPGDVLIAGTTTPAWTPIFTMASAVVTDIGGPLSHGSIVAREYGIPAVMGTGIATKRIQNGQIITVDGSAGTVTIESGEHKNELENI